MEEKIKNILSQYIDQEQNVNLATQEIMTLFGISKNISNIEKKLQERDNFLNEAKKCYELGKKTEAVSLVRYAFDWMNLKDGIAYVENNFKK